MRRHWTFYGWVQIISRFLTKSFNTCDIIKSIHIFIEIYTDNIRKNVTNYVMVKQIKEKSWQQQKQIGPRCSGCTLNKLSKRFSKKMFKMNYNCKNKQWSIKPIQAHKPVKHPHIRSKKQNWHILLNTRINEERMCSKGIEYRKFKTACLLLVRITGSTSGWYYIPKEEFWQYLSNILLKFFKVIPYSWLKRSESIIYF